MKRSVRYPKQAVRELAGLLLVLGATILSSLLLWHRHAHDQKALQMASARLQGIRAQLAESRRASPANSSTNQPLPALPAGLAPISAPQARAGWRMQLARAQQHAELIQLRYTLATRHQRSEHASGKDLALYSSRMLVEMEVAHEADFLAFIESLLSAPADLPILRECELSQPLLASPASPPRLHARCQIDWLTLARPESDGTLP